MQHVIRCWNSSTNNTVEIKEELTEKSLGMLLQLSVVYQAKLVTWLHVNKAEQGYWSCLLTVEGGCFGRGTPSHSLCFQTNLKSPYTPMDSCPFSSAFALSWPRPDNRGLAVHHFFFFLCKNALLGSSQINTPFFGYRVLIDGVFMWDFVVQKLDWSFIVISINIL